MFFNPNLYLSIHHSILIPYLYIKAQAYFSTNISLGFAIPNFVRDTVLRQYANTPPAPMACHTSLRACYIFFLKKKPKYLPSERSQAG